MTNFTAVAFTRVQPVFGDPDFITAKRHLALASDLASIRHAAAQSDLRWCPICQTCYFATFKRCHHDRHPPKIACMTSDEIEIEIRFTNQFLRLLEY